MAKQKGAQQQGSKMFLGRGGDSQDLCHFANRRINAYITTNIDRISLHRAGMNSILGLISREIR
jgi:hypothetical protein